jgi:hypothetical protein
MLRIGGNLAPMLRNAAHRIERALMGSKSQAVNSGMLGLDSRVNVPSMTLCIYLKCEIVMFQMRDRYLQNAVWIYLKCLKESFQIRGRIVSKYEMIYLKFEINLRLIRVSFETSLRQRPWRGRGVDGVEGVVVPVVPCGVESVVASMLVFCRYPVRLYLACLSYCPVYDTQSPLMFI